MQTFYTTPEQEGVFKQVHERKVKEKQNEIDAQVYEMKQRDPTFVVKYTARAHVDEEPRTFHVRSTGITFNNQQTPTTPQQGGGIYFPDKLFIEGVEVFIKKHPEYTITFYPTSKYGPTIYYTGDGFVCFLQAVTGEQLFVENPDAYEIGCG